MPLRLQHALLKAILVRGIVVFTCQDEHALASMLYHPLNAESLVED